MTPERINAIQSLVWGFFWLYMYICAIPPKWIYKLSAIEAKQLIYPIEKKGLRIVSVLKWIFFILAIWKLIHVTTWLIALGVS
jgi:hypothetical protein